MQQIFDNHLRFIILIFQIINDFINLLRPQTDFNCTLLFGSYIHSLIDHTQQPRVNGALGDGHGLLEDLVFPPALYLLGLSPSRLFCFSDPPFPFGYLDHGRDFLFLLPTDDFFGQVVQCLGYNLTFDAVVKFLNNFGLLVIYD